MMLAILSGLAEWELAKKVFKAGASLFTTILYLFPNVIGFITDNPTFQFLGSLGFTAEKLMYFFKIGEDPYPVRVNKTINELYVHAFSWFDNDDEDEGNGKKSLFEDTKSSPTSDSNKKSLFESSETKTDDSRKSIFDD